MIFNMGGGGGENVTPETNEYTSLLEQALTAIEGKVWVDKKGTNLWRKLTAKNGTFIEYVVSDNANTYPDGAMSEGYYYEKANGLSGIDCGILTLSASQETITVNHRLGQVPSIMALIPISGDAIASTTFLQVSSQNQFLDFYSLLSLYYDSSEGSYEYNANIPLLEGTATTATLTARSTSYKFGAYTYLWIVYA